MRRLWQFRSLVAILLGLWIVSLSFDALVIHPIERSRAVAKFHGHDIDVARVFHRASVYTAVTGGAFSAFSPPGISLAPSRPFGIALAIGLMVWLLMSPRKSRADDTRPSILAPALLLLAYAILDLTALALFVTGHAESHDRSWLGLLLGVLSSLAFVPATALLGYVALAIARGEVPTAEAAVRLLQRAWLPLLWLALVFALAGLPGSLMSLLPPRAAYFGLVALALGMLRLLVALVLMFVRWIILQHETGFSAACRRNFAMLGQDLPDILTFGLRYVLLAFPALTLAMLVSSYNQFPGTSPNPLGQFLFLLVGLIGGMAGIIWYLELDRQTPDEIAPATAPGMDASAIDGVTGFPQT